MTHIKPNAVALLVHACDEYKLLYRGFGYCFNKYWDPTAPTNNYFATEEQDAELNSFMNIKSGKGKWSDRLRNILTNHVKEDYLIYMQEDMWLTKPVNAKLLSQIMDYAVANSIDCIKLHSTDAYETRETAVDFEGLKLAILNNENSKYLMCHHITLWKKEFFLSQLHANETPWENELAATKRLRPLNPTLYQIDFFAKNGKREVNSNLASGKRSEYFNVSKNGVLSANVQRYFDLLSESASEKEYVDKLKYNFRHQVTHNGKQKPYKRKLIQVMRRWVKNQVLRYFF